MKVYVVADENFGGNELTEIKRIFASREKAEDYAIKIAETQFAECGIEQEKRECVTTPSGNKFFQDDDWNVVISVKEYEVIE